MSVINQALRDIDARHPTAATPLSADALLQRYAQARLKRGRRGVPMADGESPQAGGRRGSVRPLVLAASVVVAAAGGAIGFGLSEWNEPGSAGRPAVGAESVAPKPVSAAGAASVTVSPSPSMAASPAPSVSNATPAVLATAPMSPATTPDRFASLQGEPLVTTPAGGAPGVPTYRPAAPESATRASAAPAPTAPAPTAPVPAAAPSKAPVSAQPFQAQAVTAAAASVQAVPAQAVRAPTVPPQAVPMQAAPVQAASPQAASPQASPQAAPQAAPAQTAPAQAVRAQTAPVQTAVEASPPVATAALGAPAAPPSGPASIDVRQRPDGADALQARASAALAAGDGFEAQRLLRAALALDPGAHTARQALLAVLARGERGASWLDALAEAAVAAPDRFGLLAARGLAEGGRMDSALAALALVPAPMRGVEYLTTAGLLAQRAGKHGLAIDQLAEALGRTAPDSASVPALRVAIADSLAARGDTAAAREQLEAVAAATTARSEVKTLARERLQALPR